MRSIDIHAHLIPQCFWKATEGGTDWPFDMDFDWPVSWVLGLESITQGEKEAILWKKPERPAGYLAPACSACSACSKGLAPF